MLDEAAVGEALKNAFAILVTGAGVAEAQGGVEAVECGVRFINNNWRAIRPSLKLIVQGVRQCHIAVERLLDKQQPFKEWPKRIVVLNGGPEGLEIGDAFELLVAIQRKGEIRRSMSGDYLGECFQAGQISVGLAVDFDFEMAQPVGGDAVGKCLWKLISNRLIGGDIRRREGIGQANGVPGNDRLERLLGQPFVRLGGVKLNLDRGQGNAQILITHRGSKGFVGGATGSFD